MAFLKTKAVILRTYNLGESDKIISLFTREAGIVKAVAKGAVKSRKRFGGVLLTGSHIEAGVFLKKKTTLHRLDAADLIEPYAKLNSDPILFTTACHLLELSAGFAVQQVGDRRQFTLLTSTLRGLCNKGFDERLLRIFELRTLSYAGHAPNFEYCAKCGNQILPEKPALFSIQSGSVLCGACLSEDGLIKLSAGARKLFNDVLKVEAKMLPRLVFRPSDLAIAKKTIPPFCEYTLGRKLRSLRMLRRLTLELEAS